VIADAASDSLIADHLLLGDPALKELGDSNPHGWGIACFSPLLANAGWPDPALMRAGSPADHEEDPRFDAAVARVMALDPTCAIAHIRRSAGSHTGVPDPHPFWRDGIALAHNGTVRVAETLALLDASNPAFLAAHPPDYTDPYLDSELFLLLMIEMREFGVSKRGGPSLARSYTLPDVVLETVLHLYNAGALLTAANCLVASGGDTLVAVRFDLEDEEWYRVRFRQVAGGWVVASQPLGSDTTGWGEIPPKHLAVFTPSGPPEFVRIFPPSGPRPILSGTLVDDDTSGESAGNGDGDSDAGERVELVIRLLNEGDETVRSARATLSSADTLCQILDGDEEFGDIAPGLEQPCAEDFDLLIDSACPDGHQLNFMLRIEADSALVWNHPFTLTSHAPVLAVERYRVLDGEGGNGDGRIDPGERFQLIPTLANSGSERAGMLSLVLDVEHPHVSVLQGEASVDSVPADGQADAAPPFEVEVAGGCPAADVVLARLHMASSYGFSATTEFFMPVGGFFDDMEDGPGGWSSYPVDDGFIDQWHRTTYRNDTPGGAWSWKFGGINGTNYGILADGALESQAVTLHSHSWLRFRHWIAAEISATYSGYCYDGGIVELSLDGENWQQITPLGGYPYRIRNADGSCALPAGTPAYSGAIAWEEAVFEIAGLSGQGRFRFRFASDDANNREGWYIDEVEFFGCDTLWSSAPELTPLDLRPAVGPSSPNPGQAGLRIPFRLPGAQHARLGIFDLNGRVVRTLIDGPRPPGAQEAVWDGRDDSGRPLPSGPYFYRLETTSGAQGGRLVLIE